MNIKAQNTYFILVEPQTAGNIGSAARALKTMGFSKLILVNPQCDHQSHSAWQLAYSSDDVLFNAQVFPTLSEAIADLNFVVATTQRSRNLNLPVYSPKALAEKVIPLTENHKIGIVFGRESSGLNNEEVILCDAVTSIDAHTNSPSLNLSQAVMLYSYELYNNQLKTPTETIAEPPLNLANHQAVASVLNRIEKAITTPNTPDSKTIMANSDIYLTHFRHFFIRCQPTQQDVQLMHRLIETLESKN